MNGYYYRIGDEVQGSLGGNNALKFYSGEFAGDWVPDPERNVRICLYPINLYPDNILNYWKPYLGA